LALINYTCYFQQSRNPIRLMKLEMIESDKEELLDDEFLFHSYLYCSITVVFAMAVLSKYFSNDLKFGFRGFLTLSVVFIGEPLCHFLLHGPTGVIVFGLGCIAVYSILPAGHWPATRKSVLITGRWLYYFWGSTNYRIVP